MSKEEDLEDTIFYDDFFHYSVVLNTEFMTAADFLFDGLESMIYVTYFQSYSESKIFKSYYQIAVGIERIQKIILNTKTGKQVFKSVDGVLFNSSIQ